MPLIVCRGHFALRVHPHQPDPIPSPLSTCCSQLSFSYLALPTIHPHVVITRPTRHSPRYSHKRSAWTIGVTAHLHDKGTSANGLQKQEICEGPHRLFPGQESQDEQHTTSRGEVLLFTHREGTTPPGLIQEIALYSALDWHITDITGLDFPIRISRTRETLQKWTDAQELSEDSARRRFHLLFHPQARPVLIGGQRRRSPYSGEDTHGRYTWTGLEGGSPPMTRGGNPTTSKHDFEQFALQMPSASRPGFATHHSSSLPSTPYQQSRRHSFDRGPPSPAQGVRDNSPRSVHSETDSKGSSRKATSLAICKYETGMAFSRRRVPYSIGGDKLERATSMPKKYLNPQEEEKLSGDMRELYDRLLPSTESEERRLRFVQKLESLLNKQWPGNSIKVHVFGSSGNMLCTSDSDGQCSLSRSLSRHKLMWPVDICITTPMKELSSMCMLAKSLAERKQMMSKLFGIVLKHSRWYGTGSVCAQRQSTDR